MPTKMSDSYRWQKLGFITFHTSPTSFVLLCFDIGRDMQLQISQRLAESRLLASGLHIFSIHTVILLCVSDAIDRSVWAWRDAVRSLEKTRGRSEHRTQGNFDHMHEIARHLIHCSETLSTALSVVDSMIKECSSSRVIIGEQSSYECLREMEFIASLMRNLLHRSNALEKRMQNEIALVCISYPVRRFSD